MRQHRLPPKALQTMAQALKIIGSVISAFIIFKALGLTKPYVNIGDNTFMTSITSAVLCILMMVLVRKHSFDFVKTILKCSIIGMISGALVNSTYDLVSFQVPSLEYLLSTLLYTGLVVPFVILAWVLGAISGFFLWAFNVALRPYNACDSEP